MAKLLKLWECGYCGKFHYQKVNSEACEKSHFESHLKNLLFCSGCGDTDCNGECEISHMDFNE